MNRTVTLTGETALAVKYAIALARTKSEELASMTDEEVLSRLIEIGFDKSGEVQV